MPKDLFDILDTTVKIGLGALISAVATYWVTKLNHRKAIEKDGSQRRRELIEDVAENIERLFALLFRFRAGLYDWISARDKDKNMSDERHEEILEIQREIPGAYKEITNSEAKLLLLGEKRAQDLLRKFGDDMTELRKKVRLGNKTLTAEEVRNFRSALLSHREDIFDELSKIYI